MTTIIPRRDIELAATPDVTAFVNEARRQRLAIMDGTLHHVDSIAFARVGSHTSGNADLTTASSTTTTDRETQ